MKQLLVYLSLVNVLWLPTIANAQKTTNAPDTVSRERPFIAIWRWTGGYTFPSNSPRLRIAIWRDGSVLVAKNPSIWEQGLLRGKIAPYRIAHLMKALGDSEVFALKETNYLPVDAPTDCIMVDLGTKKQMLYCDEEGLLKNDRSEHRDLKKCWMTLNHLALLAFPDRFEGVKENFTETPASWFLDENRQSK